MSLILKQPPPPAHHGTACTASIDHCRALQCQRDPNLADGSTQFALSRNEHNRKLLLAAPTCPSLNRGRSAEASWHLDMLCHRFARLTNQRQDSSPLTPYHVTIFTLPKSALDPGAPFEAPGADRSKTLDSIGARNASLEQCLTFIPRWRNAPSLRPPSRSYCSLHSTCSPRI